MAKPFPTDRGPYTGRSYELTQDGRPEVAAFGVQVDWATVTALGSDTTFPDGIVVPAGEKVLKPGQLLLKITSGGSAGKYGPYDPDATDGRQTLTRGEAVLVNQLVHEDEYEWSLPGGGVIGGKVWYDRLKHNGTTTGTKAAGPTLANLLALFPRLHPVKV